MATTTPVPVQVFLVMELPGKAKCVSALLQGEMYDEPNPNTKYKKCIALTGFDDPGLPPDDDGHLQLRDWVRGVTRVVMFSNGGASAEDVNIGGVNFVGLTSETPDTETKVIKALNATPIAPITVAGLQSAGL